MIQQKLYETDFNIWLTETINQLKTGQFQALDLNNLIEELENLGKSDKTVLESNLMILLAHLLKLKIQSNVPDTMKISWYNSVIEHRKRIQKQMAKMPSLKSYLPTVLTETYQDGRELAIKESKFAKYGIYIPNESDYPEICPFTMEQILDEDFYGC